MREEELLNSIDSQIDSHLESLSHSQSFLSHSLSSLANAYKYTTLLAHTIIGGGSDVQVLDVRHVLLRRLTELGAIDVSVDAHVPSPTFVSPPSASLHLTRLLHSVSTVHESLDAAMRAHDSNSLEGNFVSGRVGGEGSGEGVGLIGEMSAEAIKKADEFLAQRKASSASASASASASSPHSSSFLVTLMLMALLHVSVYWMKATGHPFLAQAYR